MLHRVQVSHPWDIWGNQLYYPHLGIYQLTPSSIWQLWVWVVVGTSAALTDVYCVASYSCEPFPIHLGTGLCVTYSDNYCGLYCQWWREWECNILWCVGGSDNEYQWNLKLSGGKWDGSWGRGLLLRSKGTETRADWCSAPTAWASERGGNLTDNGKFMGIKVIKCKKKFELWLQVKSILMISCSGYLVFDWLLICLCVTIIKLVVA